MGKERGEKGLVSQVIYSAMRVPTGYCRELVAGRSVLSRLLHILILHSVSGPYSILDRGGFACLEQQPDRGTVSL